MRIAAIDIGTNTILMLVADCTDPTQLRVLRDEHVIARLGKGVDDSKRLTSEAVNRTLQYLSGYKLIAEKEGAERIVTCGTSALRDAENRDEFVATVRDQIGLEVEILKGNEEAELTYLGAVSNYVKSPKDAFVVLDIGGGSTEVTQGEGFKVRSRRSFDIGSVRLTERILRTSPPTIEALHATKSLIQKEFSDHEIDIAQAKLIGVAGTLTTLAALDLQLASFDREKVGGHVLTLDRVRSMFEELSRKTRAEIEAYPQILPGRADIIVAGVFILLEVLQLIGAKAITVSDRGLRYGMVLRELERGS
ncbi:MAG TPA: Ppx/GppA phosphatase family protein [Bacteroidota bacterium]|nr:Ppx/GppA phosphatase family protein [Bacteroidota bacterium]